MATFKPYKIPLGPRPTILLMGLVLLTLCLTPVYAQDLNFDPNAGLPEFMEIDEIQIPIGPTTSPGVTNIWPGASYGYLSGYPDGSFGEHKPLTRGEALVIILRVALDPLLLDPKATNSQNSPSHHWLDPYIGAYNLQRTHLPLTEPSYSKYYSQPISFAEFDMLSAQFGLKFNWPPSTQNLTRDQVIVAVNAFLWPQQQTTSLKDAIDLAKMQNHILQKN